MSGEAHGGRWRRAALLGAAVALPRLLVFPFNENLAGDAVPRVWLGDLWARAPHVIGSFDQGGFQYGPLQLYLVGLAGLLWPAPEHAGRLVSLLAGVLSAWPLHVLTRRVFGTRAADVAVLLLAAWGLHIQCSTTAASEALGLLLVLATLALLQVWLDEQRRDALWGAALVLNLACATRYDAWLLVPLLGLVVWWRARRIGPAIAFVALSCAFALPWMFGNYVDRGDPLYPFTYINAFHRAWYPSEQRLWGASTYRLMTLLFWPGTAVMTLTPLVAVAGLVGLWRGWKERPASRWLVLLVLVPTAAYTYRSTVAQDFAPLARFALKEVALLLPFVWVGARWALEGWSPPLRRAAVGLAAASLVGWTVWLGAYTFRTEGAWPDSLRAISPTSTNKPELMRVAGWLRAHAVGHQGVTIFDVDPRGYDDIQLSFFSGVPFERGARLRARTFERRLRVGPARWLVRFDDGALQRRHLVLLEGAQLVFRGLRFVEVPGMPAPYHVYRRAD